MPFRRPAWNLSNPRRQPPVEPPHRVPRRTSLPLAAQDNERWMAHYWTVATEPPGRLALVIIALLCPSSKHLGHVLVFSNG